MNGDDVVYEVLNELPAGAMCSLPVPMRGKVKNEEQFRSALHILALKLGEIMWTLDRTDPRWPKY